MTKIRYITIAALSAFTFLVAADVHAQQAAPSRDPGPGREPSNDPKIPRKWRQEPYPYLCGALLIPCSGGTPRPDQKYPGQVDPHEPNKPDPEHADDPSPKPKPGVPPQPPKPQPNPNEGPTNKPGHGDDDI